jgi:hypothetical protein
MEGGGRGGERSRKKKRSAVEGEVGFLSRKDRQREVVGVRSSLVV